MRSAARLRQSDKVQRPEPHIAPLPTALGDCEPELERVFGPIPELTRIWRILTTQQLRRTPRVRAFFDFMVSETDLLRPILTG